MSRTTPPWSSRPSAASPTWSPAQEPTIHINVWRLEEQECTPVLHLKIKIWNPVKTPFGIWKHVFSWNKTLRQRLGASPKNTFFLFSCLIFLAFLILFNVFRGKNGKKQISTNWYLIGILPPFFLTIFEIVSGVTPKRFAPSISSRMSPTSTWSMTSRICKTLFWI